MSRSNRSNFNRYNRYVGRSGRRSNYERGMQRRKNIVAGLVTSVLLLAAVSVVWFIATVVNIKNGVGNTTTPIPTQTVDNGAKPTDTPAPTPSPTFTQLLTAEVQSHERKPVVLIDAGHGFNPEGAREDGGKGIHTGAYVFDSMGILRWEDFINLDIALKLRNILETAGFEVRMTREEDKCVQASPGNIADLVARREMANKSNADAFVSIHQNTVTDPDVHGTQVWCNSRWNEYSDELSACLLDAVTEATGFRRIKVYNESYKPEDDGLAIPKANKPTALIECGFMTNPDELEKLLDDAYQQRIAEGIAMGLVEFFKTVTIWK